MIVRGAGDNSPIFSVFLFSILIGGATSGSRTSCWIPMQMESDSSSPSSPQLRRRLLLPLSLSSFPSPSPRPISCHLSVFLIHYFPENSCHFLARTLCPSSKTRSPGLPPRESRSWTSTSTSTAPGPWISSPSSPQTPCLLSWCPPRSSPTLLSGPSPTASTRSSPPPPPLPATGGSASLTTLASSHVSLRIKLLFFFFHLVELEFYPFGSLTFVFPPICFMGSTLVFFLRFYWTNRSSIRLRKLLFHLMVNQISLFVLSLFWFSFLIDSLFAFGLSFFLSVWVFRLKNHQFNWKIERYKIEPAVPRKLVLPDALIKLGFWLCHFFDLLHSLENNWFFFHISLPVLWGGGFPHFESFISKLGSIGYDSIIPPSLYV